VIGVPPGTEVFDKPVVVGNTTLEPGIVTIEPIVFSQFDGKKWWLSIAGGLADVDTVALGDATRRSILTRLIDGPLAVGELAREFPVSRPAITSAKSC